MRVLNVADVELEEGPGREGFWCRAAPLDDLACLPEGPAGGHRLENRSGEPVRLLAIETTGFPAAVRRPQTGEWRLTPAAGAPEIALGEP